METLTSSKLTNGQVVALIDEMSKAMDAHTKAIERLISTAAAIHDPEGSLQPWLAALGHERIAQTRARFQAAPKSILGIGWTTMAVHEHLQATEVVTSLSTEELKVKESDKKRLQSALDGARHSFDNLTKQFNAALGLMKDAGTHDEHRVPGQVLQPLLTRGIRQVQVDWSAPPDADSDTDASITYYIISYSEGGTIGPSPETVLVGSATTRSIVDDLENGKQYTFTVTAVNRHGAGITSPPNTVGPLPNVPGPIQNLQAATDIGTVKLTWSAGTHDADHATTSFVISYHDGPIIKSITVDATASTDGSYEITVDGLRAGGSYTFTVVAWNQVGPSTEVFQLVPSLPDRPDAPVLQPPIPDTDKVTLTWSKPNDNGSAITGYVISVTGPGVSTTKNADPDMTSLEVDDLVNDGTYIFSVAAKNGVHLGPASPPVSITLPVALPSAPPTLRTIQDVALQAADLLRRLGTPSVPAWISDYVVHLANVQLLLSENDPGIDPVRDRRTVTNIMDDYQTAYKRLPGLSSGLSGNDQLQVAMLALHAERLLAEISKQIETVMNQGDLIGARS